MKNTLLIIIAALVAVFAACKKDKDESSEQAKMLYGKWRESFTVLDTNSNNILDNDQYIEHAVANVFTFVKGGSATGTCEDISCTTANFQWALLNNNSELQLINTSPAAPDTNVFKIYSLTASKMVLSTGITGTVWSIYEKK